MPAGIQLPKPGETLELDDGQQVARLPIAYRASGRYAFLGPMSQEKELEKALSAEGFEVLVHAGLYVDVGKTTSCLPRWISKRHALKSVGKSTIIGGLLRFGHVTVG